MERQPRLCQHAAVMFLGLLGADEHAIFDLPLSLTALPSTSSYLVLLVALVRHLGEVLTEEELARLGQQRLDVGRRFGGARSEATKQYDSGQNPDHW